MLKPYLAMHSYVPAHTGGVDLRSEACFGSSQRRVPAHTGGVDLRNLTPRIYIKRQVPAHTGGVDLRGMWYRDNHPGKTSPPTRAGWI